MALIVFKTIFGLFPREMFTKHVLSHMYKHCYLVLTIPYKFEPMALSMACPEIFSAFQ